MQLPLRSILGGLAICIMLMLPSGVQAEPFGDDGPGGGKMREKMEARIHEVFKSLNLSDEQKKLLEENKKKEREINKQSRKAMQENRRAMGEELKKENVDMAAVKALHEKSKQLHNQMEDRRLDAVLAVRKILTKEQFAKFGELMEKERPKWRKD